jgi:hypothetical protein
MLLTTEEESTRIAPVPPTLTAVLDPIISGVTTLVAAFAGAWFAYALSKHERTRDLIDARVAAANRAIFALLRQFNSLHIIRLQEINPRRGDPLRCLNIPALSAVPSSSVHVDLDALTFLLETDDRQVLGELMSADNNFHSAVQAITERSACHRNAVQPVLAAAEVHRGQETNLAEVQAILGHALHQEISEATDLMIQIVDQTLVSTQAIAGQFREAMLRQYPKRTFIRFLPK